VDVLRVGGGTPQCGADHARDSPGIVRERVSEAACCREPDRLRGSGVFLMASDDMEWMIMAHQR
jgi:hypothetical protein